MRAAYSGPPDGPGPAACRALGLPDGDGWDDPVGLLAAVESGEVDVAVVPFEDGDAGHDRRVVDHLVFTAAGLVVQADVLVDVDGRSHRCIRVGTTPAVVGASAQTLLFVVPALNRPGTWAEVFGSFSARGINVTGFDVRPLGGAIGMYGLLLEFEGGPQDPLVREALADVMHASSAIKVLGTFVPAERAWGAVVGRQPAGQVLTSPADVLDGGAW